MPWEHFTVLRRLGEVECKGRQAMVLWFFSRFVFFVFRFCCRRQGKYAKTNVFVSPGRRKYALSFFSGGSRGEAPGFLGKYVGKCMENHGFVSLLILKYWFYMVRFVSKTIIKTKREKNHSTGTGIRRQLPVKGARHGTLFKT